MIYNIVKRRLNFGLVSSIISIPLFFIFGNPLIPIIGIIVIPTVLLYSISWIKSKSNNTSQMRPGNE